VTELQKRSEPLNIQAFRTSIWDETLYAVSVYIIDKHLDLINHRLGQKLYTV
jgi:hypothetical protein